MTAIASKEEATNLAKTVAAHQRAIKKGNPKPGALTDIIKGGALLCTHTSDPARSVVWARVESGKAVRADLCERLRAAGYLRSRGDGLLGDDGQVWAWGGQ